MVVPSQVVVLMRVPIVLARWSSWPAVCRQIMERSHLISAHHPEEAHCHDESRRQQRCLDHVLWSVPLSGDACVSTAAGAWFDRISTKHVLTQGEPRNVGKRILAGHPLVGLWIVKRSATAKATRLIGRIDPALDAGGQNLDLAWWKHSRRDSPSRPCLNVRFQF
jgi:hypothetical protein